MASYIGRAARSDEGARDRDPSDRRHERRWHFCVACSVAAVGRGCNTTDRVEVIWSFRVREPSALGSV
jgi:hypothetical protein